MSFPKKGKFFPGRNGHAAGGEGQHADSFAAEIAAALRRSPGLVGAGIKIVASWTGANEKTVKNWFSGRYGPSGEHLAVLVQRSDEVLSTFLVMAGREDLMAVVKLAAAEKAIMELLAAVRSIAQVDDAIGELEQGCKLSEIAMIKCSIPLAEGLRWGYLGGDPCGNRRGLRLFIFCQKLDFCAEYAHTRLRRRPTMPNATTAKVYGPQGPDRPRPAHLFPDSGGLEPPGTRADATAGA